MPVRHGASARLRLQLLQTQALPLPIRGSLASDYPLWPLPAAASGSGAANDFITPANAPVPADMDPGLFPMGQPADHYASDGDLDRGFAALLPLPQSQHAVVCQPQASSAAALLAETASNGANSP